MISKLLKTFTSIWLHFPFGICTKKKKKETQIFFQETQKCGIVFITLMVLEESCRIILAKYVYMLWNKKTPRIRKGIL